MDAINVPHYIDREYRKSISLKSFNMNILKSRDLSKENELDSYDLKQVLMKPTLDFMRPSNHYMDSENGICDLRHESLNHILKNNMEIVQTQDIDLKPLISSNRDGIDEDNNNNSSSVILNDLQQSGSGVIISKSGVDEQFQQLIDDDETNDDCDVKTVSEYQSNENIGSLYTVGVDCNRMPTDYMYILELTRSVF